MCDQKLAATFFFILSNCRQDAAQEQEIISSLLFFMPAVRLLSRQGVNVPTSADCKCRVFSRFLDVRVL